MNRPRRWMAALAVTLAAAGCGTGSPSADTSGPASDETVQTDAPTTSVAPTTSPAPIVAATIAAWDDATVAAVCYQDTQVYPQVPTYTYDLRRVVRDLLGAVGVIVQPDGMPCDAVLDVQLHLEGRAGEYEEFGTVYSGMLRRLDVSLLVVSRDPLVSHHETDLPPGTVASSFEPRTPEEFVEYYADVWPRLALAAVVELWGPAVAVEALRDEAYAGDAYPILCELSGAPVGECLPMEYPVWRAWWEERTP